MHSHYTDNIYKVVSALAGDGERPQRVTGAVPVTPSYDVGADAR